jgi:hypothetical protein
MPLKLAQIITLTILLLLVSTLASYFYSKSQYTPPVIIDCGAAGLCSGAPAENIKPDLGIQFGFPIPMMQSGGISITAVSAVRNEDIFPGIGFSPIYLGINILFWFVISTGLILVTNKLLAKRTH